jgi:hypothetical protein
MDHSVEPIDYWDLEGLGGYYFEDSYVEQFIQSQNSLEFKLVVVLTESHKCYHEPNEGEQYCYANAKLEFCALRSVEWLGLNITPTLDIDGSIDFGNIDVFQQRGDKYYLLGGWGEVLVASDAPAMRLLEKPTSTNSA